MKEQMYKMTIERRTENNDPVITPCVLTKEQYEEIVERYVVPNDRRRMKFAEDVEKRVQALDKAKQQGRRKK